MARDPGLEQLVHEQLQGTRGISEKPMFGGLAWMLHGHLMCAARADGMLVRLGSGGDAWALSKSDIEPMISRGRPMRGWVRAGPSAYGDDTLRTRLIDAALHFVRSLPPK